MHRKVLRGFTQGSVLIVALLIPVFDIIRFDIVAKELYLFGQVWSFAPQWDFMSGAGGNPGLTGAQASGHAARHKRRV